MNKKSSHSQGDAASMFGLIQAARALEDRLESSLGEVQLSLTKQAVLTALVQSNEPLTLGELATAVACVRSNMTQVVDRLEGDGLVKRVADPSDRRVVRAQLTEAGVGRQGEGQKRLDRIQAEFSASTSASERAAIDRMAAAFAK